MCFNGVDPDCVTIASVIAACARLSALQDDKKTHGYIIKRAFSLDLFIGNTLIDMYSKCGCISYDRSVFDKMSERDVVTWTATIVGYGHNREEVVKLFKEMQQAGVKSNVITYNEIDFSFCSK